VSAIREVLARAVGWSPEADGLIAAAKAELKELESMAKALPSVSWQEWRLQAALEERDCVARSLQAQLAERDRADAELRAAFAKWMRTKSSLTDWQDGNLVGDFALWAAKGGGQAPAPEECPNAKCEDGWEGLGKGLFGECVACAGTGKAGGQ
jgi:hypothetical protein